MMYKVARSKSKSETDSVRSVALSLKHPYKRAASAPGVMCNVGKHSALGTKTSGGGGQSLFYLYSVSILSLFSLYFISITSLFYLYILCRWWRRPSERGAVIQAAAVCAAHQVPAVQGRPWRRDWRGGGQVMIL